MAEPAIDLPSETTETEAAPPAVDPALREALVKLDRANVKKVGAYHFTMAMGALTLWGTALVWAETTGWLLAHAIAVANAVIAGTVLASLVHEWGHFTGARLSGAVSPALDAPKNHFFMFDFKMDENDVDQFTAMSWGGIVAPWILVALLVVLIPVGMLSAAALVATLVARAVSAGAFEVPIVQAAQHHGDPKKALGDAINAGRLEAAGPIGYVVGGLVFAMLAIAG